MAERENRKDLAKQYMKRAEGKLISAKILLEEGRFDDAISRAYYATYFSAFALLFIKGELPKTHSGLINLFGLRLVKENIVPKEYVKILSELFNARQNSDYEPLVWFDKEDAEELIKKAEKFVSKMKESLSEMLE